MLVQSPHMAWHVSMRAHACVQVRMEELWKSMRQQEDKRAATPGLLSKLRKNMSSSGR